MRQASLLLLVLLSGCYSLGPLVTDVTPAGPSADGRQRVEVRRCMIGWGMFKQLQLEDCKTDVAEMPARRK